MAYPLEKQHVEYMQYVERVSNGEDPGPQLTKSEWIKRRAQQAQSAEPEKKDNTVSTVLSARD